MDSFKWISVTLSLVLGLGVTRLLSAAVAMFRSRGRARLDWVPLAWAACIFLWQLQYWWALIELPRLIESWTIAEFLLLLVLALLLFLAAALVLPPAELEAGESLSESFARDGRWALLCVSAYFGLSVLANWALWQQSPFSLGGAVSATLMLLPLAVLGSPSRRPAEVITLFYAVFSLFAAWYFSPGAY